MLLQVCLCMTVALIGFRLDLYSILHGLWLCILFSLSRNGLSAIWNVYMVFTAVLIPIQYVMAIGLPPGLCIGKLKASPSEFYIKMN